MNRRDITIDDTRFTLTTLGHYGFSVGVRKWNRPFDKNHFIIKTIHSTFDKELYYYPHTPMLIDSVYDEKRFSTPNALRVLDMPIKFSGNSEYRIPRELSQFDELIAKIVSFEHGINPYTDQYYAYITVDQGKIAEGETQRRCGCHVDGFQGARIREKRLLNRSYIVYDNTPPVFYAQKFRTDHLDEETDDFFLSFDEQAREESAITFDPYSILLINPFTVHKATPVIDITYRTFFRLSFDTIKFDRYGNTHNNMFDYKWDMVTRDTQKHLIHNPLHHKDAF